MTARPHSDFPWLSEAGRRNRDLAIELDDPHPDDRCPYCGNELRMFLDHRGGVDRFQHRTNGDRCEVTTEALYARRLARELIRDGTTGGMR